MSRPPRVDGSGKDHEHERKRKNDVREKPTGHRYTRPEPVGAKVASGASGMAPPGA